MRMRFERPKLVVFAALAAASVITPISSIRLYENRAVEHSVTKEELLYVHDMDILVEKPVDNVSKSETTVDVDTPAYTDQELEILAIIIYQEAGSDECSDDTRRKVGSVFINRVNSTRFPDTFEEVATQERQYGTLHWTGVKWPDRAVNEYEAHAVERAYTIAEELLTEGSILPDNVIWQAEFIQGDGVYCYQDDIYFCYTKEN